MLMKLAAAVVVMCPAIFFLFYMYERQVQLTEQTKACSVRDGKIVRGLGRTLICVKREAIL